MKSNNNIKKPAKPVSFKRLFAALAVFALCVVPTFAASSGESISELDSWAEKILELFQSPWVKAILLVALIVEAIGLVLAGYTVMALIIRPFSGYLVDSFPRKTVLIVCNFFISPCLRVKIPRYAEFA